MLHAKGSLLSIDLTEQETLTETIDDILASFTGGRGAATKLVHERVPFDADLLGPENRVVFTTGPLQLSNMSFTGRMNATTVSPLTDGLLSSNAVASSPETSPRPATVRSNTRGWHCFARRPSRS